MSQSDADCDDGGGDGNCTPWAQIVYLAPGPPSSESPSEARLHVEGNPMLVVALLAAVASLQPHAVRWSSLRPGLAAAAAATMPHIARADKGGIANRGHQEKSSQVKSSQVKSSQVKSSQVKSSQVKSSQVRSVSLVIMRCGRLE